jgi:DNA mismatch repair protein MutL
VPVTSPLPRRIRILRDEVSRKIAAGEVIDRPFSIVRELLDNAIDAGALSIDVHLEAGGLGRVRVVDDGAGMGVDDLSLCWQPHATSKIESEDDLLTVSSLGFRGEALSSIAVCSRLVVVSATAGDAPGHRLDVHGGRMTSLAPFQGRKGTVVEVSELFYNYPARKKFLRSAGAESGLCRAVFVDRAVAHPDVAFRLFTDGDLKLALPTAEPVERIGQAYAQLLDARLLGQGRASAEGLEVRLVGGMPELRRRDRKLLQVFVNGRRVLEFSLMQAAEYGYAGFMPGGWYPVAFVFVTIDPSLIDFNIHPAKKEVRFRNLPEAHKAVVGAARTLLQSRGATPAPAEARSMPGRQPELQALTGRQPEHGVPPALPPLAPLRAGETAAAPFPSVRFLGQVFGVFLVFELPGRIMILDQHAAHERIIFERLSKGTPALQEMLFPLSFDVSEDEDARITSAREELEAMGIAVRRVGARAFEVTALSADFHALPEDLLVELVRGAGAETSRNAASGAEEWKYALRATAACRMAIKEGDRVDALTATELGAQALQLQVPRCPHGRPIWHELSEESLLRLVDRPVPSGPRSRPSVT